MRRRRTRSSNAPCTFIRRSRNICRSSSANWSRSSKREEQDYSEDREKYVAPNSGRERLNGDAQRSLCTLGLQSEKELAVKAARIHSFGPPDVVVVEDVPVPSPGPGEILVRVTAAGVAPWDAIIREGQSKVSPQPPLTLGSDLSGVVEQVGPGVTDFARPTKSTASPTSSSVALRLSSP